MTTPTPLNDDRRLALLTGATGYVGGLLLPLLEKQSVLVRCLARNPDKIHRSLETTQIVRGDVLDTASLAEALQGVHTAYYLVHLMSGSKDFEKEDRQAATNFATAAKQAGVRRIIYLGGLGDDSDPTLSPHLRSRHEVGEILRESGVETIEFRASLVIGTGSLSFDLVRSLTDRLPVMLCPKWLTTPTQPIAVDDVLAYLLAAMDLPSGESRIFEIGCEDVTTYGGMVREYAHQQGLRRWLIFVPVLTPYLSSLWLALVTPASFEVGRHLIEGLKNPTVVQNKKALSTFSIQPMSVKQAIQKAIASTTNQFFAMPELTAYHEAGHALLALLLGGEVKQVTIEPDNDDGPARHGDTQVLWRRANISDKEFAVMAVQVSLAGPAAEMIYSGDPFHPGMVAEWAGDWRDAWEAAAHLHADENKRLEYLERVSIQLYHRLKEDQMWAALASLADHLLAHETLEGEQVEEIVGEWLG